MRQKISARQAIYRYILWAGTLAWLAFCFYLSWQTGEETGEFSQRIAQFLLEILGRLGCVPDPQRFHAGLRLFAHFGVFFVTGILVAFTLLVTFPPHKSGISFCFAVIFCTFIAVLAEVGKLRVPGRHLTWSEAGLNVFGAVCGIDIVYGVVLLGLRLQRRSRPSEK